METLAPALASDVANKHRMLQIGHELSQFGNFEEFAAEQETYDCADCRITQTVVPERRKDVRCRGILLDSPDQSVPEASLPWLDTGGGRMAWALLRRGHRVSGRRNLPIWGCCCESGIFVRSFKRQTQPRNWNFSEPVHLAKADAANIFWQCESGTANHTASESGAGHSGRPVCVKGCRFGAVGFAETCG